MRIPFNNLFEQQADGSTVVRLKIRISGITLNPGAVIPPGGIIGGIALSSYVERDFEVELEEDTYVVRGIY